MTKERKEREGKGRQGEGCMRSVKGHYHEKKEKLSITIIVIIKHRSRIRSLGYRLVQSQSVPNIIQTGSSDHQTTRSSYSQIQILDPSGSSESQSRSLDLILKLSMSMLSLKLTQDTPHMP